ncbi:MAG: VWA domain-containing protein [Gammaproteobacteria bacterium]|nr:VWA domain-containing protein [Gammaproteobacteria bacterium]
MALSNITVGSWWPLLLLAAGLAVLGVAWARGQGTLFPDIDLLKRSAPAGGLADRLPLQLGVLIAGLLMLSLMDIAATRLVEVDRRARDFLVIVDTSRSMREDTALLRAQFPTTYERKADYYVGQAEDPAKIPHLARYEVARESLLDYLASRRDVDRVGLIYFNSMVYLMSGFTSNFEFIEQQLASMDPYVTFGTNIRWALEQALDLVERYPGRNRRAIILLTDAEARNTDYLQQQLERLRQLDIAFYLLWITSDTADGQSPLATEFLRTVRTIGSVYTIDDVGEGYLDEALGEIAELEDYAYREARHERVDLSRYILAAAQWLLLVWVLLVGTLWLPLSRLAVAGGGAK